MHPRHAGDGQPVSVEVQRPRGFGTRWLGLGIALALGGAITLATASASASAKTVNAELSFSGIATTANLLGGSEIGVHPGDTVNFVPSTIPTAGLTNIPGVGTALDSLLRSILGSATGYQITMHLPSTFPGGARNVTLGACSKQKNLAVTFPNKGDFTFTWSAVAISPLCLLPTNIGSLAGNQLKSAGIALNASNQWVADIHVATNAVAGGIGIQLPGVSIAPSLPILGQLPTIGLPGLNLGNQSGGSGGGNGGGGGGSSTANGPGAGGGFTAPVMPVPAMVVPYPNVGAVAGSGSLGGGFSTLPNTAATPTAVSSPTGGTSSAPVVAGPAPRGTHPAPVASATKITTGQIPLLLAILAIAALTLVTGTYARLFMMRRPG